MTAAAAAANNHKYIKAVRKWEFHYNVIKQNIIKPWIYQVR